MLADDSPDAGLEEAADSRGETEDNNSSKSIALDVSVGGSGGTGGSGGAVRVTNDGSIGTIGAHSDGILAQSIGGGGGQAGAASTASSNDYSGQVAVGGTGGSGGNGGAPTVTNTGSIITKGALSSGIVAQSIAGGGGIGGVSASSVTSNSKNSGDSDADDGGYKNLQISVGGNGGHDGTSGPVSVTSSGTIQTSAHDSIGIVAQSIAGGGGIVKTLATDLEGAGGTASATESDYNLNFKFGGSNGSTGESGMVDVTTEKGGAITTHGDDSYGILAQTISGGGGLVQGGKPVGTSGSDFFGTGKMSGSVNDDGVNSPTSGNSGLFVTAGDNITTTGKGAVGILAQSIGGGGGLAGDTGWTEQFSGFGSGSNHSGSGGYVGITVDQGATVSTSGDNAPAIFVQSIGGGGGRVTNENGAYIGTAGGTGKGGAIDITVNGTVEASGQASMGIFAQSEGDSSSTSPIKITVSNTGVVSGGPLFNGNGNITPAIYVDHGGMSAATPNVVTNSGLLTWNGAGSSNDPSGTAVYSASGYTQVINNAGGTIVGAINLTNNNGGGCLTNNGTVYTNSVVGSCVTVNNGVMDIRSAGKQAQIVGGYVGNVGSTLVVGADFASGKSDVLNVNGPVTINGKVDVEATSLRNSTVTVLTSSGPLQVGPTLQAQQTHLFDYQLQALGNSLQVTPEAHFAAQAVGLGNTEQVVANSLQTTFDSGGALSGDSYAALSKILGNSDYASALRSIAGEGLGTFGAFRINSSRAFAQQLYEGCHELSSDGQANDSCSWTRMFGSSTDQAAASDTLGYHANAYTLQVGTQISLADNLALVGSLGSERTHFHGDDSTSQISGSAALGGLGLNYVYGRLELSGAIDGTYGWYRSTRTVTVAGESASADANPRQWQMGAHARAAYSVPLSSMVYAKPFVEGHAIHVTDDAFTEDGSSPFRLAVDGRSDTTWLGAAGVEFGANVPMNSGAIIHPFVSLAAEFDHDRMWTTTAHFADMPDAQPFSLATAGPGTLGRFDLGVDLIKSRHLSFSIAYEPEFGQGYSVEAGTARVSYTY